MILRLLENKIANLIMISLFKNLNSNYTGFLCIEVDAQTTAK